MNKSVTRRAIAILVTACFLGSAVYLVSNGIQEAWTALTNIAFIVIGFYFGVKAV